MLLNCGIGEDSWESLGLQGGPTSLFWGRSVLGVHWKDWCWSWNSNAFATWYEELTHWKRPWCWETLRAGGEVGDSSEASILRHSACFIVQLSHAYMTTGKTIALTRQTFVDKVMPLLLNMLSRLVITFLPRSRHLLISWLQSPSAVIHLHVPNSPPKCTGWISLQSMGFSRVFSNTTVQKHQFFGTQISSQTSSHIHT